MKEISLTQGYVAIVDNEDYEELMRHKWYAHRDSRTGTWYAQRNVPQGNGKQTTSPMHRVILGAGPGEEVDHRNGDGLDNRRSNVRLCTKAQNTANRRKRRDACSSRFKGVARHKATGKWRARIMCGGKPKYLGLFADEIEAARVYNAAALKHFREFALLNVI